MAKAHKAPKFLPPEVKQQWKGKYEAALKSAKIDHPDDERAQHTAAHKAANTLLKVTPPTTAAEIAKLPDWQVVKRDTKLVDGEEHAVVVTIDGRKYSHPKKVAKAPAGATS